MDLSASTLIAGMLISSLGFGLFLYGKKQTRFPQLVTGLVMMIYPCFGGGAGMMLAIAGGLLGAMWLVLRLSG